MPRQMSTEFLSDPHGYARANVLALTEGPVRPINLRAVYYDQHHPERQESFLYSTIDDRQRVAFGEVDVGHAAAGFQGAKVIRITEQYASGLFPMFWLPYQRNSTRKMTLKDKRDAPVARREGGNPRVFFTSALNGCSVFIEGSREHPTVTHVNAGEFRVTEGPVDEGKTHDDRIGRTLEIERRVARLPRPSSLTTPGKVPGQTLAPAAILHGHNYLPNYFRNVPNKQNVVETAYIQQASAALGVAQANIADVQVNHSALVFGAKSRQTDEWQFWVQQRARVQFDLVEGGWRSCYVGRKVKPFWPGNSYLHVRGNTPHNAVVIQRM